MDYYPGYFVELDSYEARKEYEDWLDSLDNEVRSPCCDASIWPDIMICSRCLEHCE